MNLGAFSFFVRGHRNGVADRRWLIAALHWPRSITWRWLLDWTPWGETVYWRPIYWSIGKNGSGAIGLRVPLLGQFHFAWQRNMPWPRHTDSRSSAERP